MSILLEMDNISFSYDNEPIFANINFSVNSGDFIALVGGNGAGKSTLFKLLSKELDATEGIVKIFGTTNKEFKDWHKIGYLPQNSSQNTLNFPATSEEIVMASLFSQVGLFRFPKKHHKEKVQRALLEVGMEKYAKRLIGTLSGGQQQRVFLARVLVSDPEIMLLDEPNAGIDIKATQYFYELLKKLNYETGLTILMVTHDIGKVYNYVSRILCLEDGSLVELSKEQLSYELLHKHKHKKPITPLQ